MKNLLILLAVTSFLMTACDNGTKTDGNDTQSAEAEAIQQAAWDEMMVVHDEVMPKMSDINRVNGELQDWAVANKDQMADGDLERISLALKQLGNADDGMMNWMNSLQQLDGLRAEKNQEEIMTYLQEQTKIIAKVKKDMLYSIKDGETLLAELKAG